MPNDQDPADRTGTPGTEPKPQPDRSGPMKEAGDLARVPGTREHADRATEGRHPGVRDALQWLTFSHLPEALRVFSQPFYIAAVELVRLVRTDSPELTTALNKLIEAKDSGVRAGIKDSTGRAGSVPRPDTVVNPPTFGAAQVPARPDQMIPGAEA